MATRKKPVERYYLISTNAFDPTYRDSTFGPFPSVKDAVDYVEDEGGWDFDETETIVVVKMVGIVEIEEPPRRIVAAFKEVD